MASTLKSLKVCPYSLKAAGSVNAREQAARVGLLLRCEFDGGDFGYADFHPLTWEQKQSPAKILEEQIKTSGLQWLQSLKLAKLDAQARAEKTSLFRGLSLLESHFLVTDISTWDFYHLKELRFKKFKALKIKLGRNASVEKDALLKLKSKVKSDFTLRLDFNAVNTPEQWKDWEHWLNDNLKSQVEFVEDPCPWNEELWRMSRLPLAIDFEAASLEAQTPVFIEKLIWKPALGDKIDLERWRTSVIVTHIMDHPLGQLGALYTAQVHNIQSIGGYLNPGLEDSLGFFNDLKSYGPWMQPEQGCGWGFDERLAELKWQSL